MYLVISPELYEKKFVKNTEGGNVGGTLIICSETSCHSMVQWNEKGEIVSGICICNYPNVPSVIPEDWTNWLYRLYR